MTLIELLSEKVSNPFEELEEEKSEYNRYWYEYKPNERHYSKNHNLLYGEWRYKHRENAGCKYGDGKIVHHKDNNKKNNSKKNLQVTDRSGHCKIDPNAAKPHEGEKCKDCGGEYWGKGYCHKCYMRHFRKGDFGNYDKNKNYSKKER